MYGLCVWEDRESERAGEERERKNEKMREKESVER
jgi:hypothetical protein